MWRLRQARLSSPVWTILRHPIWAALALMWMVPTVAAKPNVLLVSIDTLRADHLGCYGYQEARTPILDSLAREGIRFDRAFSPVPLTLPAHASLLTGAYPTFHGIRDNSGYILPEGRVTLSEVLKEAGYATAAFVGAFVLDSKFGLNQGFDRYFDNFDLSRFENISPGYIQRTAGEVVAEATSWLESGNGKPFFVWVHLYDPHDPYTPPEPYASRHPGRPYDGEIEYADSSLGLLLDWLRGKGEYDNTLVIVVGDHGESLGEHGEEKHGLFIYNATLHVPLVLRLPGGEHSGTTITEAVSLVDIFPTVVQLLNLDRRALSQVQGRGLTATWLGKPQRPVELYAESYYPNLQFGWSPLRALISGGQKYIQAPTPELYDLGEDFGETANLAPREKALSARLREQLSEFTVRYSASSRVESSTAQPDAETLQRLQSLGYVALSPAGTGEIDDRSLADPKDQIGVYHQLTNLFALSTEGRHEEAIPGYIKILARQPDLKIARYKLGQAYFSTGNYPAALTEFQKTIEMGGPDALAVFDLAQTYMRLRRIEDAALGFRRTLEIDPTHYRAMTNLGVIYKNQGKLKEATDLLEGALKYAPGSVLALSNLGVVYSLTDRHEKALETLQKAIAFEPENAILYANLAAVYQRKGDQEAARQAMERARALNPDLFKRR